MRAGWWGPRLGTSAFAVVDLETTGLDPGRDRVVQLAVVRTDARGAVVDEWETLVDPGRDPGPTEVHGITAAALVGAPTFADVADELRRRLRGAAVVGHNLAFDAAFLAAEHDRAGTGEGSSPPRPPTPWLEATPGLCTLRLARRVLPGPAAYTLSACCERTGVVLTDAHTALGDARATAGLLAALLDRAEPPSRRPWPRRRLRLA